MTFSAKPMEAVKSDGGGGAEFGPSIDLDSSEIRVKSGPFASDVEGPIGFVATAVGPIVFAQGEDQVSNGF
jgi:hypothetical protein